MPSSKLNLGLSIITASTLLALAAMIGAREHAPVRRDRGHERPAVTDAPTTSHSARRPVVAATDDPLPGEPSIITWSEPREPLPALPPKTPAAPASGPRSIACPCWEPEALLSITAENIDGSDSCEVHAPLVALIVNVLGSTPGVEGGFGALADHPASDPFCHTRDYPPFAEPTTREEALVCMEQIWARCAEVGHPVP